MAFPLVHIESRRVRVVERKVRCLTRGRLVLFTLRNARPLNLGSRGLPLPTKEANHPMGTPGLGYVVHTMENRRFSASLHGRDFFTNLACIIAFSPHLTWKSCGDGSPYFIAVQRTHASTRGADCSTDLRAGVRGLGGPDAQSPGTTGGKTAGAVLLCYGFT